MDTQRIAAILLIAAFATVMLLTFVTPPGLYQPEDLEDFNRGIFDRRIEERLRIIETYRTRWLIERASSVLFFFLSTVGFSLLAYTLRARGAGWIPVLGAVAIVAGGIVGMYFLYQQTIDPRGGYTRAYASVEGLTYWLSLAGTLLFGVAFLQFGLPKWLGYLTAGAAALYGIVFLITGYGFMTPWILGFLSLVIGVVLLRRQIPAQEPMARAAA